MAEENKIASNTELPPEVLSKVLIHFGPTRLQSILRFAAVDGLISHNPEILNAFCRTTNNSRQECLEILKSNHVLLKVIQWGLERLVTFSTHQSDITQLSVYNKMIFVSSDDQTVKVFDFNGIAIKTFVGHIGGVWTFDCAGNKLVTGSTDKTARIWDIETERLIQTLKCHRSTVRVLRIYDGHIITGSRDYTIGIWTMGGELIYRLNGHNQSVRTLDVSEKYLVSGSYDGCCKLWDYRRGKFIRDVHRHKDKICCVVMKNGYIASGGYDTEVKITKVDGSHSCSYKLHSSVVGWIDFVDNCVVSSGLDGIVVKYNYVTNVVDYIIRLGYPIKGQRVMESLIVLATVFDVRVFSLRTGWFVRTLMTADAITKIEVVDWRIIVGYQQYGEYKISIFSYEGSWNEALSKRYGT